MSGVHGNTFRRDDKSQVADFLDMEFAFFEFDKQAMSEEFFENKADMLDMFLKARGCSSRLVYHQGRELRIC